MLVITIKKGTNIETDLQTLDYITGTLDCFPGNDEVHLILHDNGKLREFRMPQRVDTDNMDMFEVLYSIDEIEIDI